MTEKLINDGLVSIDNDTLRVERGPRRVTGKATPELLRATGRRVPGEEVTLPNGQKRVLTVVHDALGKPVVMGKPMTYLDKTRAGFVWYLYRWETVETEDGPVARFVEKGTFEGTREDAVATCRAKFGGGV